MATPPPPQPTIVPTFDVDLEGSIPRRHLPVAYRFTLSLCALAIVLLPLAYLALIVAIAWGVWIYMFGDYVRAVIRENIGVMGWLVVIGPITAGSLLTLFLIKPLFSRRPKNAQPLSIDPNEEPQLRHLIEAVCDRVGAPRPSRIEVDCQLNASARHRRGFASIGQRDYVLTLGLPLVAGLDSRQFAGVLAHEIGHFSQGAGLAATHVISLINGWFARVVFERDALDRQLERAMDRMDYGYAGAVLAFAVSMIWIGRKILHGLMLVGEAITCLQLRQLEFDADYYCVAVSGSASFATLRHEMRLLGSAHANAFASLDSLWKHGRLADDYPAHVLWHRAQSPQSAHATTDAPPTSTASRWFATHPTEEQRITAAAKLALPGIFRGAGPALSLFQDFAALSRKTTAHFYRHQLNLPYDETALVTSSSAATRHDQDNAAQAARARLAGSVLDFNRPLTWQVSEFTVSLPRDQASFVAELRGLRHQMSGLRNAAEANQEIYGNILRHTAEKELALALIASKTEFRPSALGLAKADRSEAENDLRELAARRAKKAAELHPFESSLHRWVCVVGNAARDPALTGTFSPDKTLRLISLTDGLAGLSPWFVAFPEWNRLFRLHCFFASPGPDVRRTSAFQAEFARIHALLLEAAKNAPGLVGPTPYPFATDEEARDTAAELLERSLTAAPEFTRPATLLQTIARYQIRLLGEIALLGEELEQSLDNSAADCG